MDVTAWQPVGAKLTGLAVDEVSAGAVDGLRQLLAQHGVLVLPGQSVDDAAFVTFLRSFGDLQFTDGETPLDGFPDLNVVSNVGRAAPPRSQFHVDTSYVRNPPAYTALRAVQVPSQGGATLFTNQYRAFETLPYDVRERLDGRTVTHVVTGVEPGEEASAEHPVF
ncbi:MAG: TauD/TfdA family dioxygenase, partial [Actinomycetota bacterium]|nr:TauD/TfdA family dioxygenase [Actinomycetota bacterium]